MDQNVKNVQHRMNTSSSRVFGDINAVLQKNLKMTPKIVKKSIFFTIFDFLKYF